MGNCTNHHLMARSILREGAIQRIPVHGELLIDDRLAIIVTVPFWEFLEGFESSHPTRSTQRVCFRQGCLSTTYPVDAHAYKTYLDYTESKTRGRPTDTQEQAVVDQAETATELFASSSNDHHPNSLARTQQKSLGGRYPRTRSGHVEETPRQPLSDKSYEAARR